MLVTGSDANHDGDDEDSDVKQNFLDCRVFIDPLKPNPSFRRNLLFYWGL